MTPHEKTAPIIKDSKRETGFYVYLKYVGEKFPEEFRKKEYIDAPARSYIIDIKMKLEEALIISSGELHYPEKDAPYYKFYNQFDENGDEVLLIPGSTIKGTFRTYSEFFLNSDFVNYIYGSKDKISYLLFSDVFIPKHSRTFVEISRLHPPQKTIKGDYIKFYKCHPTGYPEGKKVRYEAVKKGTKIFAKIISTGPSIKDIAYFLTSVGLNPKIELKFYILMGEAKNQGYGLTKIDLLRIKDLNENTLYDKNSEILNEKLRQAFEKAGKDLKLAIEQFSSYTNCTCTG